MIGCLRADFPALSIHRMAQLLGVPRSLVYRKQRLNSEARALEAIERLVTVFLGYGYRRVCRALRTEGFELGERRVRRLMRENGLLARRPRSKGVTRPRPGDLRLANLIKEFRPSAPNQVWAADTTRIRTQTGPVYLASLLDLFSRKVVAFRLSRRNDEQLVRACLEAALEARRPGPGWIHHSDRGSTYTAAGYTRRIRNAGGRLSLAATGCPLENACAESFFRTLKLEEVDRNRYETFLELEASLEVYIDGIYNAQRMHSSLNYQSPDQFEQRHAGEAL
jgi:putative transposase